jgi:hypothetical protein
MPLRERRERRFIGPVAPGQKPLQELAFRQIADDTESKNRSWLIQGVCTCRSACHRCCLLVKS